MCINSVSNATIVFAVQEMGRERTRARWSKSTQIPFMASRPGCAHKNVRFIVGGDKNNNYKSDNAHTLSTVSHTSCGSVTRAAQGRIKGGTRESQAQTQNKNIHRIHKNTKTLLISLLFWCISSFENLPVKNPGAHYSPPHTLGSKCRP